MIRMKEISDKAKKVFNDYDRNKDGVLNKSELKPLLDKVADVFGLSKVNDKEIEEGIKTLDLNKNGVLEFNEFFKFFREVYKELELL